MFAAMCFCTPKDEDSPARDGYAQEDQPDTKLAENITQDYKAKHEVLGEDDMENSVELAKYDPQEEEVPETKIEQAQDEEDENEQSYLMERQVEVTPVEPVISVEQSIVESTLERMEELREEQQQKTEVEGQKFETPIVAPMTAPAPVVVLLSLPPSESAESEAQLKQKSEPEPMVKPEPVPTPPVRTMLPVHPSGPTENPAEFVETLRNGRLLIKEDRSGKYGERVFYLREGTEGQTVLTWEDAGRRLSLRMNRAERDLPLSDLSQVVEGRLDSDNHERGRLVRRPSFNAVQAQHVVTLVFQSRHLIIVAKDEQERTELFKGFQELLSP